MKECASRGKLKKTENGVTCGDFVEIDEITNSIEKILPRKSYLIRPNIANVELVNIVLALFPKPDYYMIDKLLAICFKENIEVIITINKMDISREVFLEFEKNYKVLGLKIFEVSAKDNVGIDKLKDYLTNKLTCFAGQSAVGKTSIINLLTGLEMKVGELSDKSLRGKHTTTVTEIIDIDSLKIADTPGFSVISGQFKENELASFYPEYEAVSSKCRFRGCSHINEPNCEVRKLVESGEFSKDRYERYLQINKEIKEFWRNHYE